MKKYFTTSLIVLFAGLSFLYAQNRETKNVGTFNKIAFRTSGKLYLKQGTPQKVELEGSPEILANVDVDVEGSRLIIEFNDNGKHRNWTDDEKLKVYVTVENIEGISVNGSGDVIGETKFTSSSMDLKVSGSGSLVAEVDVNGMLESDVSGSGEIELKGKCKNLESHVSGSGRISVENNVAENASFDVSGSGKIEASGTANAVTTHISGSGRVMAANLETNKCEVHISGSGNVEINVKETLDAQISGSGSVSYKGNPSHVNSNSSGSGHVRKM